MKCLVYTDLLLDDLCALEYLSLHYDNAVIVACNDVPLETLCNTDYASRKVNSRKALTDILGKWFKHFVLVDEDDYSIADKLEDVACVYSLAPLTKYAHDIERYLSLSSIPTVIMAGEAGNIVGREYNASADQEAYNYVMLHVKNKHIFTKQDCERLYAQHNIPFFTEFQNEYHYRMEAIFEKTANYDLQVVYWHLNKDSWCLK